jgi:GNAT superfamily N-acetyltransferase
VVCWDAGGQAVSYVGAVLRDGTADGRPVKMGGVGGVKTHPRARGRGLASRAIGRAMELFRDEEADFALLVCEPLLVPFYERLGWRPHAGGLLVRQQGRTVPFTFNLPMASPVRNAQLPVGVIDLLGPPW